MAYSIIYDMPRIHINNIHGFFNRRNGIYWNDKRDRFSRKRCLWGDQSVTWGSLSDEEKDKCGKIRADSHNRASTYKFSYDNNIKIIDDFAKWCCSNEIELIFLVFPVTKSYEKYFDPNIRTAYYEALQRIKAPLKLLDLPVQIRGMTDNDFNDTDHLNDVGAGRLTNALLKLLH